MLHELCAGQAVPETDGEVYSAPRPFSWIHGVRGERGKGKDGKRKSWEILKERRE